ncbi:MAG TPA: outer membrane protein assembly factor BamD [Aquifex aeolicus]|nr:outer membrane protein assembly factor BamD [Aquifex aeolicus]
MGRKSRLLSTALLGILVVLTPYSCTPKSEERRKGYAREFYTEGLKEYRKGDYGDAKTNFERALNYIEYLSPEEIKNAKYLLVKSAYKDKDYVDAIVYAEDFLSNYPGSREAEEVFFILVASLVKVAPDPYRDQTYTIQAIQKAKEFLSKYPNSEFVKDVEEVIEEANRKLAYHEYYVAKFYEEYGYTYNAAVRYREVLINFSQYFSEEKLAYHYIKNLILTPKQVKMEKEKIEKLIKEARKKLKKVKKAEERKAIENRIEFLISEIKRWEEIKRKAHEEAIKALKKYRELYGENAYYKELIKLIKKWKS